MEKTWVMIIGTVQQDIPNRKIRVSRNIMKNYTG